MTFEEVLEYYEIHKTTVQQNADGSWDYDISPMNIKFDLTGINFNPDKKTKSLEKSTIINLQDVFNQPGWELKNATKGLDFGGLLMVEHHQTIHNTDELIPSGILVSKAGYWWYGLDDVGFIVLSREFLLWCYEFNLKTKFLKDGPIESQTWNKGYAFLIPFDQLPFLIKKYKFDLL